MPNKDDDIEAAVPKGEKAITEKLDSNNSIIMDEEAKELLQANKKASSAMKAVWKESLKLKQVRAATTFNLEAIIMLFKSSAAAIHLVIMLQVL